MNYRLPNPLGDRYRDNFDMVFARVHLKTGEKNGVTVLLCGRNPEGVSKVTEKPEEVNCKHCILRIKK